jgi:hypothetical protein
MLRHLMRALLGTVGLLACSISLSGQAYAQLGSGVGLNPGGLLNDPFTFYYAFYLPNQQLQALRPTPNDSINTAMMARQYYAQTEQRRSLYNPISPYAEGNYDPLRPYSQQTERVARPYRFAIDPSNADGTGPSLYYNRTNQFFPTLRDGRGPNANVATTRRGAMGTGTPRRGSGIGGMGGMGMGGMGMPGMGMPGMGMGGMGMGGMGMM